MLKLLLPLLLLVPALANAQHCPCSQSLRELTQTVEQNYAGYADKVKPQNRAAYQTFVAQLRAKADPLGEGKDCQALLKEYVGFFKDPHLRLAPEGEAELVTPRTLALDLPAVTAGFRALDGSDVRGLWQSDTYELAIVPAADQPDAYDAVVVKSQNESWKPGMVKMRLKRLTADYYEVDYLTGGFERIRTKAAYSANVLDMLSVGVFEKVLPKTPQPIDTRTYQSLFPDQDIKFSFPSDSVAVLFLGSFGNHYEKLVDSLMVAHRAELEKRPYWIVDVSYNGGGGTGTYKALLPYLYTGPIQRSGSEYRLSAGNVAQMEKFLREGEGLPGSVKTFFQALITQGKRQPGSWYTEPGKAFRFARIQPNPRQVAVLVSEKTASSGEIFVMDARQSRKVTVFGTPTAGVVDYGDGFWHALGCGVQALIPTRRSAYLNRVSYDNKGLRPDVALPGTEVRPYRAVLEYYRKSERVKE